MLFQVNVFATSTEYDFTSEMYALDDWSGDATVVQGNGIAMSSKTMTYNDNLGNDFTVEGTIVNGNSGSVYTNHWTIYLGDHLNFRFGAGGDPRQKTGVYNDDTLLQTHDGMSGSDCRIEFKFIVSGNTLKYSATRYKVSDGTVSKALAEQIYDITDCSAGIGNFKIVGGEYAGYLENIKVSIKKPIDAMMQIPRNGAGTTNAIKIYFSNPVEQTALQDVLTLQTEQNARIASVVVAPDGMSADIYISDATDGEQCTISIPQGFDGANYDEFEQEYTYTFVVDNTTKSYYPISLAAPKVNNTVLYDDVRFEDDYYYSGEIIPTDDISYIYLATNAERTDGYRIAITSGDNGRLALEKLENSVTSEISAVNAGFTGGQELYFGAEVSDGNLTFNIIGNNVFAEFTELDLSNTQGYVGIGCGESTSTFKNLSVFSNPANVYAKPKLLSASEPFHSYTIYEKSSPINVELELDIAPDQLVTSIIKIDDETEFALTCTGGSGEGKYKYKAEISSLIAGAHTLKAIIVDKRENVFQYDSKGFMLAEKPIQTSGFKQDGLQVTNISDVRGKTVDIEFTYDSSGYIIMCCLYNGEGKMELAEYEVVDNVTGGLRFQLPDIDLAGYTLSAFLVDKMYDSIPLSGIVELK